MRRICLVIVILLSLVASVTSPAPASAQDIGVVAAFEGVALGEVESLDGGITDRNAPESDPTVSSEDMEEYVEQIFVGSVWTFSGGGDFTFELGPEYDLREFGLDEPQATLTGSWEERNGGYDVEINESLEEASDGVTVTIRLDAEITPEQPVAAVEYVQLVDIVTETEDITTSYFYELELEMEEHTGGSDDDPNGSEEADSGVYVSERHGFQLAYDPENWTLVDEGEDIDPEDRASLTNGPSLVTLIGDSGADADELEDCLDDATDALQDELDIDDLTEREDEDASGDEADRAWTTLDLQFETQDGATVELTAHLECRALTDETIIVIRHVTTAETYQREVEDLETLLAGLAVTDINSDDNRSDSANFTLPDDPDTVVIYVSVNSGSLPPEFQAGYQIEITADGDVTGELFPEGSLADEPTAEVEEVDVELGEDGLIELLTGMDELGFFDLPQEDELDIPDGGSVYYLSVELADDTWEVSIYSLDAEERETFEEVLVLVEETVGIERPEL